MPGTEPTPQQWREVLAAMAASDTAGPEPSDAPDAPRADGSVRPPHRRGRRSERRTREQRQTRDWLRRERARDPLRPGGALLVVAVLLAVGIGGHALGTRGSDSAEGGDTTVGTAEIPAPPGTAGGAEPTASPERADLTDSADVAEQAVRRLFTRNPPKDGSHRASVRRASPYLTPELTANLAEEPDKSWGTLVSRGGRAQVRTTKSGPAGGGLPPDTPVRVWRKVTATIDVRGYEDYRDTLTVRVEVTRSGQEWRASRMVGL